MKGFLSEFWDVVKMILLAAWLAYSPFIGFLFGAWLDGVDVWGMLKEAF
jgi:hypothetical protein